MGPACARCIPGLQADMQRQINEAYRRDLLAQVQGLHERARLERVQALEEGARMRQVGAGRGAAAAMCDVYERSWLVTIPCNAPLQASATAKATLEEIKQRKLAELEAAGVPTKYAADLQKMQPGAPRKFALK